MSCNNCSAYSNMISAMQKAEKETRKENNSKLLEKQNNIEIKNIFGIFSTKKWIAIIIMLFQQFMV